MSSTNGVGAGPAGPVHKQPDLEAGNGDRVAIIWEGDDPNSDAKVTYRELHRRVCQLANAMRGMGVKKGDRVCIYLPMIVEAAVAMLACARVGAVPRRLGKVFSTPCIDSLLIGRAPTGRGGRAPPGKGSR